ncbi:Flp pilus assembly protein TadG [Acetobacter nitrogenifigens DSM 23921 = NBRC 105050]|uniref:TadE-like domain-containing protein n=1 Tax=Acetobacter nitrogenifigens DSM 23921 = NBRC 105050 TaxID=1120919 RepID=A0A511X6A5_9PROT|nr:TadE/TadG family type IV pilus assembly protein [Acetobacter nitrogenifigens]GBQ92573.1 Flp pilus assembly protein TadG [Acetobacter nitrogenifigens DSM 23921 = NBRC 105050]GEN58486.1 hypothetical protein ANI02nite_03700 [Acetobacter nitrogenifigens DSM 23921 = NBRC 105050]
MTWREFLVAFRSARSGVAAIEFALAAPVLILLMVGAYELEDALTVSRKVTTVAHTIANLATQYTSMSDSDADLVLQASELVLQPYSVATAQLIVSEVSVSTSGDATIVWSKGLNATPRATGSSVTLPSGTSTTTSAVILGEVTYTYTPPLANSVIPKLTMYQSLYMAPRQSSTIPLSN